MNRLPRYVFAMALIAAFALMMPVIEPGAQAALQDENTRIGDITIYTGEVLVRTKGVWKRLNRVPFPVYAADKVATKRGRAEIHFVDGGLMRVDSDSNVTVVRQDKVTPMKRVRINQVTVLVGDVFFEVTAKKDPNTQYTFRTPSMTAAVRGSGMRMTVDIDGSTRYAKLHGTIDTVGTFSQHTNPNPIPSNLMTTPPTSDSPRANNAANRFVTDAVNKFQAAGQVSEADRAKLLIQALNASAKEMAEEAAKMKDPAAQAAAQKAIAAIDAATRSVNDAAVKATQLHQLSNAQSNDQMKDAIERASNTMVLSASSQVTLAIAQATLAMAQLTGNADAVATAQGNLNEVKDSVDRVNRIAGNTYDLARRMSDSNTAEGKLAQTAAGADRLLLYVDVALASVEVETADANANMTVALMATAQDSVGLALAEQAAQTTGNMATNVEQTLTGSGIDLLGTSITVDTNIAITALASLDSTISSSTGVALETSYNLATVTGTDLLTPGIITDTIQTSTTPIETTILTPVASPSQ